MLTKSAMQGALDACAVYGVPLEKIAGGLTPSPLSSVIPKTTGFFTGQVDAAKNLFHNMRGGLGGKMNPGLITGKVPEASMELARGTHRTMAMQNLKALAPSLLAAGGLGYLATRGSKEPQQRPGLF